VETPAAATTTTGTSLAPDPCVAGAAPTRAAEWRGRRSIYFLEEVRAMPRWAATVGGLAHLKIIGILLWVGYPTWRALTIGALWMGFVVLQHTFVRRAKLRPACLESTFVAVNLTAQIYVVGCAALTGGIHSPFVPNALLPAITSLLFFGPIAASRWIALSNACLIIAMFALPGDVVGPALPDTYYAIALLVSLGWSLFMLHVMAGKLAIAACRATDSYDYLREESVSEAAARLRRLQGVGAKVAHELKNPLAAIKGLCQLIARTPESERTQERLAVVTSEISRMETILNEYLSFSRPLEDLHAEAIDLAAIGRDVLDVLAGRADQAGVTLSLDGGAAPAKGDPRRLKEALINLVSNAIEATPPGGQVTLRVRASPGTITLEVKDTGRGIAPEDLDRLGTSFFTTRPNGTGLGVVLAQGVITQHGGTLGYASTVGRGTTATITLPGVAATAAEPATRAAMVEARA
jgi:signal transduction histidine kinase